MNTIRLFTIGLLFFAFTAIKAQLITVSNPNGGESLSACTVYNISWTASATSGFYSVDYSIDGGVSWTSLATNLSATNYLWTVPNTFSSNCLVKVSDFNNTNISDQSNGAFTITSSLILTSPNGGESWQVGGPAQNITWTANGTSANLTIEYSTNAGSTWSTLTTSALASSGTYAWTIPNTPSTQALVRIKDNINASCKIDASNNLFTISPPTHSISVTFPNLGGTFYVGNSYNITWTSQYVTSPVKIDYSTDNGSTWNTITGSTPNTGSFNWTIPNTLTTTALVRVSEVGSPSVFDISNVPFTITLPTITITSPNGGEIRYIGNVYPVTWTSQAVVSSFVKIEYSADNGSTWNTVINSTANNGTYSWAVPNNVSTNALIRISEAGNSIINDISDAVFTIKQPTITVTTPNGGETWLTNTSQSIKWTSAGLTTNAVKIEISLDNGITWIGVISSTPNDGVHPYAVGSTTTTNALVRISEVANPNINDVSDAVFTIAPSTITVTSPNGGEVLIGCTNQNINWTPVGTSKFYNLAYSLNNGSSWSTITTNYACPSGGCTGNAGSILLMGGSNQTRTECSGKLFDNGGGNNYTNSFNGQITISPTGATAVTLSFLNFSTELGADRLWIYDGSSTNDPLIGIYSGASLPNGGTITSSTGSVTLKFTTNAATMDAGFELNWTGTNVSPCNYIWNLPNSPTNQALVRVVDANNSSTRDSSDATFTIKPPVVVTAANGGESWQGNTTQQITWTQEAGASNVWNIDYSTNGGTNWTSVANNVTITTGQYNWLLPNTPSNTCKVRVRDANSSCRTDISNSTFTITPATHLVTVTAPNGGENWYVGSVYPITWTSQFFTSQFVALEYSIDNGTTWLNIATSATNNGTYNWTLPNTPSTTALVRVSEFGIPSVNDISDAVFTIKLPTITVTTPNGGETWYNNTSKSITWTSAGLTTNTVKIEYSLDNGTTWNVVVNSTPNDGSHSWTLGSSTSTQALVRISEVANPNIKDVSDAVFTIAPSTITVTSPNGGELLIGCSNQNINWTPVGTSNKYNIEYSSNNGNTWTTEVSNYTCVPASCTSNAGNVLLINGTTMRTECYGKLLDNGGVGSYANSSSGIITITPAGATAVTLSFLSFATELNFDRLYIYDGPTTSSPLMGIYSGNTLPNGGTIISSTGSITLHFITNATNQNAGFEINWSGTNLSPCTYPWSLTSTGMTQALVRVVDANNSSTRDSSDATFTVKTPVTLTAPNGGESWQGNTTQQITWTQEAGASNVWNIYYTTNGGGNWTSITSNATITNGQYSWLVPNIPSGNCKVQVRDAQAACRSDLSNSTFTITPATHMVNLTAPNGGQNWYVGSTYPITWTSQFFTSTFVALEYSIDNGATWLNIATSATNNGTYNWTVPNTTSNTALVRVSEFGIPSVNDVSDAVFTISPAINVVAPNGGENVGSCTSTSIIWVAGGCSGSYKLEYSINGGITWNGILSSYTAVGTGTCSYTWIAPNSPSTNVLVRVSDATNTNKVDQSNAAFNVTPAIVVTQPNVGGSYTIGSLLNINWTSSGVSNFYNIDYSVNNGSTWNNIAFNQNITSNTYAWTVPNSPTTMALVRVVDNVNTCKKDQSDVVFTITNTATPITVITPNGGENWQACTTQTITWTASGTSQSYNLDYSTNGGSTWTSIANNYNATGNTCMYSWFIPNAISSNVLVKVTDANNSGFVDQSNATFTISTSGNPSVSILASGTSICAGSAVTFTANPFNGGLNPNYQWKINGTNAGTNSTVFTTSTLANNDAVSVVMTTSTTCATTSATSNIITITVTPVVSASVSISSSGANICAGALVSFTAAATNTGTNPVYQWKVNGNNVGLNSGLYSSSSLNNNDVVSLGLTSNAACVTNSTVVSNSINITVSTPVTASVSIVSSGANICSGSTVTFTATAINGGGNPTYQWKVNNLNVGTNSSIFTSTTLTNNDAVRVVLLSNAGCVTNATVTSAAITMTVNSSVTASISIVSSGANICAGTNATFTATAINGGTNPMYQWKINGSNVGTNAAIFNSTTLSNNDLVTCQLLSNALCVLGSPATSNAITMAVSTPVTASVTISSSSSNICSGSLVTFSASAINGGTNPQYQWKLNNLNAGTNSALYTSTVLSNGDVIKVVVTSNAACVTSTTVTSNLITMSVTPSLTPSVSISSSGATICSGSTVGFTATALNGGVNPAYQWKVNGTNVGTNSTTYSSTNWNTNDIVLCELTSNAVCTTNATAFSNTISISVSNPQTPAVNIASSATAICGGGSVTFTATPTNGGASPTYQWKVNGNNVGMNNPIYISNTLNNNDTVSCELTSNAACVISSNAVSNKVVITVTTSVNASVAIVSSSTTVCAGTIISFTATATNEGINPQYQWKVNGNNSGANSSVYASASFNNGDVIMCEMISSAACVLNATVTSSPISVTIYAAPTLTVTASATKICDGQNTTISASGAANLSWSDGIQNGVPFIPTTTHTYSVVGTNGGVCTANSIITVTVIPMPNVVLTGPDNAVCSGTANVLSASGASYFNWKPIGQSGPTVNVTPTVTTTYTVVGVNGGLCTDTKTLLVLVNPLPNVALTLSNIDTLCYGNNTYGLIGGTPAGGTYSGTGVVLGWFDVQLAGLGLHPVSYSYTDTNGCVNTATDNIWVDACNGTEEVETIFVKMYPNPAYDYITIESNSEISITLYDSHAKTLYTTQSSDNATSIDISELPVGVYGLRIADKEKVVQKKFVKMY
ncbi:MAG: T9SS type A sorting domain-containing protein [Bacteroidetes bacterium]|nr:T9SS type A sorting domain-containing protein [Bacteroidota bacterium]